MIAKAYDPPYLAYSCQTNFKVLFQFHRFRIYYAFHAIKKFRQLIGCKMSILSPTGIIVKLGDVSAKDVYNLNAGKNDSTTLQVATKHSLNSSYLPPLDFPCTAVCRL